MICDCLSFWSNLGEAVGGILGTIISIVVAIFVFITYKNQSRTNKVLAYDTKFFKMTEMMMKLKDDISISIMVKRNRNNEWEEVKVDKAGNELFYYLTDFYTKVFNNFEDVEVPFVGWVNSDTISSIHTSIERIAGSSFYSLFSHIYQIYYFINSENGKIIDKEFYNTFLHNIIPKRLKLIVAIYYLHSQNEVVKKLLDVYHIIGHNELDFFFKDIRKEEFNNMLFKK
jgi:hypothetical protein